MAVLNDVQLELQVVLGSTTMPIHQLLRMGRGAVIQLDTTENDDVVILANNLPVAKGAVVVNGNRIGIEVRSLVTRAENAR
jgi:flagellar motor switch protein FliN/FliY